MSSEWSEVDMSAHLKARRQFKNLQDKVAEVREGRIFSPDMPLWDNSSAKQLFDFKEMLFLKQKLGILKPPPNSITPQWNHSGSISVESLKWAPIFSLLVLENKCAKTHDEPNNLSEDALDSYIICPQLAKMWMLPWGLNGKCPGMDFSICKNFYHKLLCCNQGPTCNHSHKHPKNPLVDKTQLIWDTMKSNMEGMKCKEIHVTAEVMTKAGATV